MSEIIPQLRVSDYDLAISFYVKWFGFKIDHEEKPDEGGFTVQISLRKQITLQLVQYTDPTGPGTWILIKNFEKLVPFRKILSMKPSTFSTPKLKHLPEDKSILSMTIQDPFRNLIELRQQN